MKSLVSSILIFFSFNTFATCTDEISQVGYRMCLFQQLDDLEKEVKVKQEALRNKIKTWDEDPEFRSETSILFEKAVKSFRSYQEQQCMYEWSVAAGGNGANSMSMNCKIKLNQQYLSSLEIQLSWYETEQ